MIVVVSNRKVRIDFRDGLVGKLKSIQLAIAIVNESFTVRGPIRGLHRIRYGMYHGSIPCVDIQYFESATDIVALRFEVRGCRQGDSDIAKNPFFKDIWIMRTNVKPNIDFVP